ncbi:nuclear transport factor 2 family protein [Pseudemcibacter aquimaris]|uniref:nuclear transport factor 2 family protein n=1 Tax=Pseudemcibacter aquimaris TaxID=2857064 RepID=UPI002012C844|nr:nuclear transport factor 2 family protein [Pseudemcibacter aquimaris]MCC3861233.1 nuclear transport factor 2 family protein [Pseudemcibacter aquimaris]WDU58008.1 nuclear transport factor 2 family protein [Pseudemcibacter aquimaris]
MKKIIIAITVMLMPFTAFADGSITEKAAVHKVLDQVFDAMRAGDADTLRNLLLPDASLDRITPGKTVNRSDSSGWIGWVETLEPGEADEQIFDVKIHVEGPLAVAWAPFTIALNGKLTSCGVNQFTLVKHGEEWKVAYLIDTHTPEKCLPQ